MNPSMYFDCFLVIPNMNYYYYYYDDDDYYYYYYYYYVIKNST